MYARTSDAVEGSPAGFGVSGKLWNGVLVMYDRATESLWTQLDGRAISGERVGERLEHVPSQFTTWALWKREHPDTLVLEKDIEEREQVESHYADYFDDPERLFMPELSEALGGVEPKDTVFGLVVGDEALAVTEDLLGSCGIVNVIVGETPVALLLDTETRFVQAVVRRFDGRTLILQAIAGEKPRDLVRDTSSGKTHIPNELPALRVDRAFWYAWNRSHPGSRVLSR